MSPQIFQFISKSQNIPLSYEAIDVNDSGLLEFFLTAKSTLIGFNATLPHKEKLLDLVDAVAPEVSETGAVNVVAFKDGRSKGFNTDVFGITRTLEAHTRAQDRSSALIFGAGGAARATLSSLKQMGFRSVYICNRNFSRAEQLAMDFPGSTALKLSDVSKLQGLSLIINVTSFGMSGVDSEPGEFTRSVEEVLKNNLRAFVFDIVYRPQDTFFTNMATDLGLRSIAGHEMLIHQAIATWEIWFGNLPEKMGLFKSLRDYLQEALKPVASNVFLSGFMGVGKSTLGPILSEKLGKTAVDLDEVIAKMTGRSPQVLFHELGEAGFRNAESAALELVTKSQNQVVSIGGGTLIEPHNRKRISATGLLVYLSGSTQTLLNRLADVSERPLFRGAKSQPDKVRIIEDLMANRRQIYCLAPLYIKTDNLTQAQITMEIIKKINV